MANDLSADVLRRIELYMASGRYQSEEEVLLDALAALDARQEDLAALQAGIQDFEAGRVRPLEAVADEIRQEHSFRSAQ
jgi:predicted transcriptional regulator